jgi:hydrogenase maturation factor
VAKIYSSIEVSEIEALEIAKDELGLLLEKTQPEDRRIKASEYVSKIVREVLGLDKGESIDAKKGFFEMGMDSILATNLRNELQKALADRCTLTSTLTFDYPNVEKVVDYILIQSGFAEIIQEDDVNKELARQRQIQKEFESKIENASEEDLMKELQRQIEREEKNE